MSKAETIARLNALLERVRSRAVQPDRRRGGVETATALEPASVDSAGPRAETRSPIGEPHIPPVSRVDDHGGEGEGVELDIEVDVEITDLPPDVGAPIDDEAGRGSDSAERLVAAPAEREIDMAGQDALADVLGESSDRADTAHGGVPGEAVAHEPAARFESEPVTRAARHDHREEIVDRPPASSRRPVEPALEPDLSDLGFASDGGSVPRHTPPPESGQLPAPPVADFEEATGIRESIAPPVARGLSELRPEVTRATLDTASPVAEIVAELQAFRPHTFLEWLEATLAL